MQKLKNEARPKFTGPYKNKKACTRQIPVRYLKRKTFHHLVDICVNCVNCYSFNFFLLHYLL